LKFFTGAKFDLADQGFLINYELMEVSKEVLKSADHFKTKTPYKPPTQMVMAAA